MKKFEVKQTPFGAFTKIVIQNKETGCTLEVVPEKGAKVNRFTYVQGEKTFDLIEGYDTPLELEKNDYSKSSLLFPFPNRVKDGVYDFEGKTYELPITMPQEHHAIHGYIEHKKFSVIDSYENGDEYMLHLEYVSQGDTEGYPFPCTVDVVYRLGDSSFTCETKVTNTGVSSMPMGHGWHPYFTTEGAVSDLELQLPLVEKIEVDERMIPTGICTPYTDFNEPKKIGDTDFDTGFRLLDGRGVVTVFDKTNNIKISVVMNYADNKYPFVQIFIPPWRGSIAIEPMTCATDAFNNRQGLIVLQPNEKFEGVFGVQVTSIE